MMAVKRSLAAVVAAVLLLTAGFPRFALALDREGGPQETAAPPVSPPSPPDEPPNEGPPVPPTEPVAPPVAVPPVAPIEPSEPPVAVPPAAPPAEPDGPPPANGLPSTPAAPPAFTAELVFNFMGWALFGQLSEMTEEMTAIVPCYSLDGVEYSPEEYNAWQLDAEDPDLLRQQCYWPIDTPLAEYQAGEIDRFFVKLEITYADGSVVSTEAVRFEREGPAPLPAEYQVQAWYAAPIREVSNRTPSIWGQYHFTVPDTATPEALAALLPETVPVELQLYREGDPTRHEVVVDYTVRWPELTGSGGGTDWDVLALGVTPPEECTVTIGSSVYRLAPPEILPENGPELCATFHPVAAGTAGEVLLSLGADSAQVGGIYATFPKKPTGALEIVPEYSLDGVTGWTAMGDVLADKPLEQTPPKFEGYTVLVLSQGASPLADYSQGTLPGFYVRLRVEGGALAGTTAAAAWPASYDYVPPRDDTGDQGTGGNQNNAGSGGGLGAGSSQSNGQRPGLLPETPTPTTTASPEVSRPVPQETPAVTPTPQPPLSPPPAEPAPQPLSGDASAPTQAPVPPALSARPKDSGAPVPPPPAETALPALQAELPPPHEKEVPPNGLGNIPAPQPVSAPPSAQGAQTDRNTADSAPTPVAMAGVLLVGGGAVALCSGGGMGLAHGARKLLSALKGLFRAPK